MAKKKHWMYTNASHTVGVMVCNQCKQKIEGDQEFKYYRDGEDCFRGHTHRTCSQDDAWWAINDRQTAARIQHQKDYLAAMIAFRDQWLTTSLDEEITDYRMLLDGIVV